MKLGISRRTLWAGVIAGGTLLTWVGTREVVAQRFGPRALTVTYTQTEWSPFDGGLVAQNRLLLAVRSDGSQVEPRAVKAEDGKFYEQRIILDTGKGKRISVEGISESITTTTLSQRELTALKKPGSQCLDPQAKPAEPVLGYQTIKTEVKTPISTIHSWRAPDLGCVVLRETFAQPLPDGTSRVLITREAAAVSFGEPDSSLFEVPSWPERTPSQVLEGYRRKFNLPDSEDLRKAKAAKDRAYWAQQQERP
jgi:hypothetical protein